MSQEQSLVEDCKLFLLVGIFSWLTPWHWYADALVVLLCAVLLVVMHK